MNDLQNEQNEERQMIIDLVTKFVEQELMPLEPAILQREIKGEACKLPPDEEASLLAKCKELGLRGQFRFKDLSCHQRRTGSHGGSIYLPA